MMQDYSIISAGFDCERHKTQGRIKIFKILGCLLDQDLHYETDHTDSAPNIPDIWNCRSFCEKKSDFFTYTYRQGCFCKRSNTTTSHEDGTLSGSTNCLPSEYEQNIDNRDYNL